MAKTILIVEDDKSVARMLADVLEAEGFHALIEVDGEWALRTFQSQAVDLLLLDVLLPKLNGFDVLDRLRRSEKGRDVPVVMMSAVYRAKVHRPQLMERAGIVEYLDKPVSLETLREVVSRALGRPSLPVPPRVPIGLLSVTSSGVAPAEEPTTGAFLLGDPVRRALMLPVPRRGELDELPFARLYGQLFAARVTGALLLRRASVKKIVYLRDGVPVFVKSNLLSECLGHVMVRERLITPQQCDASVARLKAERRKQGEILLEMGCISPHNLGFALERQLEQKLQDIFSWRDGKYLFNDADEPSGPLVRLSVTPLELLYDGIRQMMPGERIARELARVAERTMAPPRDPSVRYQAEMIEPRAGKLLALIDGERTVAQLLAASELPRATTLALLYTLTSSALLRTLGTGVGDAGDEILPLDEHDFESIDDAVEPRVERARAHAAQLRAQAEASFDTEGPRQDSGELVVALVDSDAPGPSETVTGEIVATVLDPTRGTGPGAEGEVGTEDVILAEDARSPPRVPVTLVSAPPADGAMDAPPPPVVPAPTHAPTLARVLALDAARAALRVGDLTRAEAEAARARSFAPEASGGSLADERSAADDAGPRRLDDEARILAAWTELRRARQQPAAADATERVERCLLVLERLEASTPETLELQLAKGEALEHLGRTDAARIAYQRAVTLDGDDLRAVEGLRRVSQEGKRGRLFSLLSS